MFDRPKHPRIPHSVPAVTRRDFLTRAGGGFGALALAYLLERDGSLVSRAAAAGPAPASSLVARPPHFPARARSVIWLFMDGGPSHLDTFDPKLELDALAGQPLPDSYGRPITSMGTAHNALLATRRKFR